jgi:hypothetical protein
MSERGPAPGGAGILHYFKEAFLFRWNLLFFLGGAAAAAMSPLPDVLLPLACAAELAYLGGLTSIPRFRSAIDAKVHSDRTSAGGSSAGPPQAALSDLLRGLDPAARQRFDRLRTRCLDMQRLARGVTGQTSDPDRTDEIRTPALDRLLWAFLRILHSQQALRRFLAATDEPELQKNLADLKAREAQAKERSDERIARSLADSVTTGERRLENYRNAVSNAEFVGVELDRIEGKIQALAEAAVSHQDPDLISSQVDSVAASMAHTEEAIREMNQITGLNEQLSEAPAILNADLEREAR